MAKEKSKEEEKKKKPSLGEVMRAMIMKRTGADNVREGFAQPASAAAPADGPTPEDKKNPEYRTKGIFDEGKYERAKREKERRKAR